MTRALLNLAALLAFIAGIVAAQQVWARPVATTVLFLPVVRSATDAGQRQGSGSRLTSQRHTSRASWHK